MVGLFNSIFLNNKSPCRKLILFGLMNAAHMAQRMKSYHEWDTQLLFNAHSH